MRQRIRLNTKVVQAVHDGRWLLTIDGESDSGTEAFDELTVCNGHYTEPRVPDIPGSDHFPARCGHSRNYRSPDGVAGMQVARVSTAASGAELSQECAGAADRGYWCGSDKAARSKKTEHLKNVTSCGPIRRLIDDGRIELENQTLIGPVDSLVFATGYHYRFPFLSEDLIRVRDNWVTPLY